MWISIKKVDIRSERRRGCTQDVDNFSQTVHTGKAGENKGKIKVEKSIYTEKEYFVHRLQQIVDKLR